MSEEKRRPPVAPTTPPGFLPEKPPPPPPPLMPPDEEVEEPDGEDTGPVVIDPVDPTKPRASRPPDQHDAVVIKGRSADASGSWSSLGPFGSCALIGHR